MFITEINSTSLIRGNLGIMQQLSEGSRNRTQSNKAYDEFVTYILQQQELVILQQLVLVNFGK